jgi:hypothetical protein
MCLYRKNPLDKKSRIFDRSKHYMNFVECHEEPIIFRATYKVLVI